MCYEAMDGIKAELIKGCIAQSIIIMTITLNSRGRTSPREVLLASQRHLHILLISHSHCEISCILQLFGVQLYLQKDF